ncbi:hypothetical protein GCM10008019_17170 [Deinococcus soli (ex Cha et al. 2016)]|nr:hypothetical protein GCM10008019_17170 [Deinococcus soli (ex Cha et al. 2016)]
MQVGGGRFDRLSGGGDGGQVEDSHLSLSDLEMFFMAGMRAVTLTSDKEKENLPMELLLAGLVIVVSLILAAWQERPGARRRSRR